MSKPKSDPIYLNVPWEIDDLEIRALAAIDFVLGAAELDQDAKQRVILYLANRYAPDLFVDEDI
jgi:hypothetical protein